MSRVKNGVEYGVAKPANQVKRMQGVSLGHDDKGYFVYTHRARSGSYKTPSVIPDSRIKRIESTG